MIDDKTLDGHSFKFDSLKTSKAEFAEWDTYEYLYKDFVKAIQALRESRLEIRHLERMIKAKNKMMNSAYEDKKVLMDALKYYASIGNYIAPEVNKKPDDGSIARAALEKVK